MRCGRQRKKVLVAAGGGLLLAALAACLFLSRIPCGYFDLAAMMAGHDSEDAVFFAGGSVTMKSCCGDMPFGTYSRRPDGSWRWHYRHGERDLFPQDFLLRPGLLSVKVSFTNSAEVYTLKRKFWSPRQH